MENQPKETVCTQNCGAKSSNPSSTTSAVEPQHYKQHPSGVECIEIAENMVFPLGNAVKYVFRNQIKHENPTLDLKKALWYISRYVETLSIKAGIRGINFWSDKTRFEWKNKKSSEDKEWIHDVYVLISEAITVCASNGTGDIRRAMSEWMQCIAFERQSRRQPVGESEVGNSSGTSYHGRQNPMAKLSDAQVQEIRNLAMNGVSQTKLAKLFSVSRATIYRILSMISWQYQNI
jgi:hypothetical protein